METTARGGFVNIILVLQLLILKEYEETLAEAEFTLEMSRTKRKGSMWMLLFQNGAKHLAH